MLRTIMAVFIFIFAVSVAGFAQTREVPKDWKEIRMCGMSFLLPKGLKDQKVRGIDSCVAEFKSNTMRLGFDLGMYTAPPEELPENSGVKRETTEIDGKKTILTTSPTGLHIYVITYEGENGKDALGLDIGFKKAAEMETAKKIIQSIRFFKEK